MLADRLNYESDRVMQAIATGELTPQKGRLYLDAVCRDELQRIQRQRLVTRMDAVIGDGDSDRRQDWATREAWNTIATRGLNAQLASGGVETFQAAGATEADLETLHDALDLQVATMTSAAGTARMLKAAKDVLTSHLGAEHSLSGQCSALDVLLLRQITASAKAAA